jgi:succinoglycan biosynthesis transport protein ExoP
MELLQYWQLLRKRIWVIMLLIVLGTGSMAFYTLQQPSEYVSTATLLLNPSVPSALVPYVQNQVASNLADSYAELMRSQSFGESVTQQLKFPLSAAAVGSAVSTRLVPNTLFFQVSARLQDPEQARQLVDTVIQVFISANKAQQEAQNNQASGSYNNAMRDQLNTKLTYVGDQITSYQNQIKNLEGQTPSADRDNQLLQLREQLVSLQRTETTTIVALGQLDDGAAPLSTALIIDPPPPGALAPSRLPTNLLLAFLASAVLGVALVFLLNYLDYTVRSPEYLEQVLGMVPMAVVGIVGVRRNGAYGYGYGRRKRRAGAKKAASESAALPARLTGHNLVALEHPKSPDSESFRVLRTNLQFSSLDKPIRSLVITSGRPGEGKSFTAANLAVVMAQAGKRVILVDTDLRRPSLHKLFGLSNSAGFTNLALKDTSHSGRAIQTVPEVPNLLVVPSGPLPPNPSELLDSHRTVEVMQQLAQGADLVIYDTPPITVVTDPAILAARVDAVVLVINAATTRREVVERSKKVLKTVGVPNPIPVLNRVKLQDIHGYYYYYHKDGSYNTLVDTSAPGTNGQDASHAAKLAVRATLGDETTRENGRVESTAPLDFGVLPGDDI